jgi:hypothetical protein
VVKRIAAMTNAAWIELPLVEIGDRERSMPAALQMQRLASNDETG